MLNSLQSDILIVTMDLESLCTNISHDRGLEALGFYLRDHDTTPPSEFICELASLVLKLNYFAFGKDFFLQIKGTAMGSTFAPNYANLYVGFFEHHFVFDSLRNPFFTKILKWFRYVDDIFFVWAGTEEDLTTFGTFLNGCNPDRKFSIEYYAKRVHFLDMWIESNDVILLPPSIKKRLIGTQPFSLAALIPLP